MGTSWRRAIRGERLDSPHGHTHSLLAARPAPYLLLALAAEIVALAVAIGAAGGGHGTYLPAKLIFPYTMLLARSGDSITSAGIAVALLQFPVYGLMVALARSRPGRNLSGLACAACHACTAVLALLYSPSGFTP